VSRRILCTYLGTCLAWGSVFPLVKVALEGYAPADVVFGRTFLGAITLVALTFMKRETLPRGWSTWRHLWVVGVLASVIPGLFVALAETRTSAALAGILAGMIPLATLFFLVTAFRDEPVHRHQVVGLIIGFVGLIFITGAWQGFGHNCWWAVALLIATVLSYGAVFPYIKRYLSPLHLHPLTLASGQQIAASLTLMPFVVASGSIHWHLATTPTMSILVLGLFPGGLAFMWNFDTVHAWGSSAASTVEYVCAIVAVVEGVGLLHESLYWYQPVGGVIVIAGALVGWAQLPRRAASAE